MSDRLTAIHLMTAGGTGFAEYGRKTVPEMVAIIRARAHHLKAEAEAVLAAADADFHVSTYVGVHAHRDNEVLQKGKPAPAFKLKARKADGADFATRPVREPN